MCGIMKNNINSEIEDSVSVFTNPTNQIQNTPLNNNRIYLPLRHRHTEHSPEQDMFQTIKNSNKLKNLEIMQNMFFDENPMKLEVNPQERKLRDPYVEINALINNQ